MVAGLGGGGESGQGDDLLDERYGLGRRLGGMILLSVCPVPRAVVLRDAILRLTRPSSHPSGPLTDDPFSSTTCQLAAVLGGCDTTAVTAPPHRCGLLPAAAAECAKAAARRSAS
jgi:hypothetical protein